MPHRTFRHYAEHGLLPEAGGARDQPYVLITVLEMMYDGWAREKAQSTARQQASMLAVLGGR